MLAKTLRVLHKSGHCPSRAAHSALPHTRLRFPSCHTLSSLEAALSTIFNPTDTACSDVHCFGAAFKEVHRKCMVVLFHLQKHFVSGFCETVAHHFVTDLCGSCTAWQCFPSTRRCFCVLCGHSPRPLCFLTFSCCHALGHCAPLLDRHLCHLPKTSIFQVYF